MTSNAVSEPVAIVSNDTHVGPRLIEDLRPYCPSCDIDDFDRFAAMTAEQRQAAEQLARHGIPGPSGILRAPGHHDPSAPGRLRPRRHRRRCPVPRFDEHGTDPVRADDLGQGGQVWRSRAHGDRLRDLQPVVGRLRVDRAAPPHRRRVFSRCGTSMPPSPSSSGPTRRA